MSRKRTTPKPAAKARPTSSFDPRAVIGSPGLKAFAGRISEEWDPALKGSQAIRLYREMADSEPVLGAVMTVITGLLQQVEIMVAPADETPLAQEAARFLEECLEDMESTWEDFLAEALSMLPYGWAYFEQVFKYRRGDLPREVGPGSRYSDNRLGWNKIEIRSQDSLNRWEITDEGEVLGMWQMGPPTYRLVFIPVEKAIHFRWRSNKNNPEGKSAFRTAKRPYVIKRALEEIEAVGIERDLAGLPVLEVPPELLSEYASKEDKQFVDTMFDRVKRIRRDQEEALVIPSPEYTDAATGNAIKTGWGFKLVTSGGSRQVNTDTSIQRYEHRMLMTFMAEFLLLGSDGGGSFALAKDKTDLLVVALTSIIDSILATFNREGVSRLMRVNGFPAGVWPRLEHGDVEAPNLEQLSTYIANLVSAGVITPDDSLERRAREYGSLPQLGEGEESEVETPAAGVAGELAATALNGAQVTAAKEIVVEVVAGTLPRETGIAMLREFFQLSTEQAESIMSTIGEGFQPAGRPADGVDPAV